MRVPHPPVLLLTPQHVRAVSHQIPLVAMETHIVPVYWSLQVWGCCSHAMRGSTSPGPLAHLPPPWGRCPAWRQDAGSPDSRKALLLLAQRSQCLFTDALRSLHVSQSSIPPSPCRSPAWILSFDKPKPKGATSGRQLRLPALPCGSQLRACDLVEK